MRRAWMRGLFAMGVVSAAGAVDGKQSRPMSIHEFTMDSIDGKPVKLSVYEGKVVLLVNTASE